MKQLTLVFLVKDDQVLLAMKKRGFGAGRWNGVGGKVDAGETILQAMIRESQEEVFVTPTAYEKVAEIAFHESFDGTDTAMFVHVFICSKWEGEPKESEEMAPQWFPSDQLPFENMWPDDPYWLPQVLNGQKLTAEFRLNENDEITYQKITMLNDVNPFDRD